MLCTCDPIDGADLFDAPGELGDFPAVVQVNYRREVTNTPAERAMEGYFTGARIAPGPQCERGRGL